MGYCQNARSLPSCGLNWQFLMSLSDVNKMKYITAVLILIQRNNQQNLQQVPACDMSDQDWVSHAEMWDKLHLLISNKLSFKLNQGLSDLAFIESRAGSKETRTPFSIQLQPCLWSLWDSIYSTEIYISDIGWPIGHFAALTSRGTGHHFSNKIPKSEHKA